MNETTVFEIDQFRWAEVAELTHAPTPGPRRVGIRNVGGPADRRAPVDLAEQLADEAENLAYGLLRSRYLPVGDPQDYVTTGLEGLVQYARERGDERVLKQRRGEITVAGEPLCRFRVRAVN